MDGTPSDIAMPATGPVLYVRCSVSHVRLNGQADYAMVYGSPNLRVSVDTDPPVWVAGGKGAANQYRKGVTDD